MHQTAMLVLASEQLWPNLQGIEHSIRQPQGLDHLFIYNTTDLRRSLEPAKRLAQIVSHLHPKLRVTRPATVRTMDPGDVVSQIEDWRSKLDPNTHWIMNVTGGTKLMSFGMAHFLDKPNTSIIYRELNGQWYSIERDHGTGDARTREIQVGDTVTDDIPADLLVRMQFPSTDKDRWTSCRVRKIPFLELTRACIGRRWNWTQAFDDLGVAHNGQFGFLFEEYMGGLFYELGVHNTYANVRQIGPDGSHLQEIDLIANFRGRLFIIDCKLRSSQDEKVFTSPFVTQIKDLAETRRLLGGLNAVGIALRPNVELSDSMQSLSNALGLKTFTRKDMVKLIPEIGRLLDIQLPETVIQAQQAIEESVRRGILPFAQPDYATRQFNEFSLEEGIFNLDECSRSIAKDKGQDWFAFLFRSEIRLIIYYQSKPGKLAKGQLVNQIKKLNLRPLDIQFSLSGTTATFVFNADQMKCLRQHLNTRINKTFIDA